MAGKPYSIVNDRDFKNFVACLRPNYAPASVESLKKALGLYNEGLRERVLTSFTFSHSPLPQSHLICS